MTDQSVAEEIGSAFVEHFVDADGFRVRYWEAGSGDPVVMFHGGGGPKFTIAQDILARKFRVLTFEMPGWGASEANTRTQNLDELAETMAQAVAATGLGQYHLLGHSIGGATALVLTLAHPDRVRQLVLEAPATFRTGNVAHSDDPAARARAFRVHPERPPVFTPPGPEQRAKTGPLMQRLQDRPAYDEVVAARLEKLETLTLVLFGTEDGVVSPENGAIYKKLIPNATFILVYDAAHLIQQDRPEAFADVTIDFLERGLAFLIPEVSSLINP